jgi:hypothetical protein
MRRMVGPLFASAVVVAFLTPAAESADRANIIAQEIAAGSQAEILPLDLDSDAVFSLSTGDARLNVHATPDGMVRLADSTVGVEVTVTGEEGNRVTFRLTQGTSVSVWPIERLLVTGGEMQFSLNVTAAGWAFVVRADSVGQQGLIASCDGASCKLYNGQRIDADRRGQKIVFRAMRGQYPGSIVETRLVSRPPTSPASRPRPAPRVFVPLEGGLVDEARPGILPTTGRDMTWQTIPLPVLAWEVFRPADVSP